MLGHQWKVSKKVKFETEACHEEKSDFDQIEFNNLSDGCDNDSTLIPNNVN